MRIIFLLLFIISFESIAQKRSGRRGPPNSIGLGVVDATDVYKSGNADERAIPVFPFFSYSWGPVSFRGISLGVRVLPLTSIYIRPSFQSLEPEVGTFSEGLRKRRRTVHAGLSFTVPPIFAGIMHRISYERDVLGVHEGGQFGYDINRRFQIGESFTFMPGLFARYFTSNFTNYYYEVTQPEQRSDRPYYLPGDSWQYGFALMASYKLTENFSLLVRGSRGYFSSEIKNSPLVGRDYRQMMMFGVSYLLD